MAGRIRARSRSGTKDFRRRTPVRVIQLHMVKAGLPLGIGKMTMDYISLRGKKPILVPQRQSPPIKYVIVRMFADELRIRCDSFEI